MRVAVAFLLAACAATPPPRANPRWQTFDPSKVSAGSTIGDWRVAKVDVQPDRQEPGWIGEVRFTGEISLRGVFQPHFDTDLGALCFFVDDADAAKLPRFPNDVRRAWFCFSNESAVRAVAKAGDAATIRIRDYRYLYSHTDVVNAVEFAGIENSR